MRVSFSQAQQELLDVVFCRVLPGNVNGTECISQEEVTENSLDLMCRLVKIEFFTSLQKEINSTDDGVKVIEPKPYDVFLIEKTFKNQNINLALFVPVKGSNRNDFIWYDENDTIWAPKELHPLRKVSSLSGPSRVLENLMAIPSILMQQAMVRTNIFDASKVDLPQENSEGLNPSQLAAVSALKKTSAFKKGFFVCQGPPGTGKTTTMAKMIEATNERVIVSAPSNAATANIALKLFATAKFDVSQICVYGLNCDKSVQFLNPTFRRERSEKFHKDYNELTDKKAKARVLCAYAMWLHLNPMTSYRDLFPECKYLNEDEGNLYTPLPSRGANSILNRLQSFVLSPQRMQMEGYPICETSHLPVPPPFLAKAAKEYSMKSGDDFRFELDPITSYELVNSLKVVVGDDGFDDDASNPCYVSTCLSRNQALGDLTTRIYAIDCKMVKTTDTYELARVTLIESFPTEDDPERYKVVLDELVKPRNEIIDYVTQYSGIIAPTLENVTTRLEEVQAALLSIIYKDDVLIGQSLESDLVALQLVHMNVVDTAILFATGGRRKHSLKRLAACLLNKQIQENSLLGHCSGEDAATALILAVQRAVLGNTFMIQDNGEINCSDEATFYSADIVFCTLNSSGSAWLRRNSGPRSTFFLDEGGQCNESDFYLATTYPRVRRIVVMGDPMQLPPTVINTDCKNAGFGRSWMANIQFLRPDLVHLLDTQYRMDPAILKFPNKHFYKSRI
jgi:hypothetical protein